MKFNAIPTMVACTNVQEAVFVDTNLGTHIAVPVSAEITAKDFKRELEVEHLNYFPEIGNIRVKGLMVKRNSCYYHLSESFPLKCAFLGSNDPWCLHIDAIRIPGETNPPVTDVHKCNFADDTNGQVNSNSLSLYIDRKRVKCKRKKRKMCIWLGFKALVLKKLGRVSSLKRRRPGKKATNNSDLERIGADQINYDEEWKTKGAVDTLDETLSETVSVSGLIKKYFSDYDEVASSPCTPVLEVRNKPKVLLNSVSSYRKFSNSGSDLLSPLTGRHVRRRVSCEPASEPLIQKSKKPEVGRRLLLASESLGLTRSCSRPAISLCKFNNIKSSHILRNLVFELTDQGF